MPVQPLAPPRSWGQLRLRAVGLLRLQRVQAAA
jgi:hypothetical protein